MKPWFVTCRTFVHAILRRPWLVYSVLALAVLVPLLRPGYILTLDMVFTPRLHMPAAGSNDYLFRVLLYALHFLLAVDVIEKLILFAVLWLSGAGMYRLARFVSYMDQSVYHAAGAYAAGVFYMVNPFTYDRFMAGQYEVLLGYALLPWFARLLLQFLAAPDWHRTFRLTACAVAVSIVSIHDIGLMAITTVVAFGAMFWRRRTDTEWRAGAWGAWRFGLAALGLFLLAGSYWLVPLLLGKGNVAAQISGINSADQSAFATVGTGTLGKLGNIVRLQGFWVEARNLYVLPQTRIHGWGLINIIIWSLVVTGGVSLWRARQRQAAVAFAAGAAIAGLLALGVLNGWPIAHLPFLAGYREPEKFVALIALAYAVFAGRGVAVTLAYCRTQGGKPFGAALAVAVAALPVAWTPTMLSGFDGQLKPVQYPPDWSVVNARLESDPGNFQTLFLPWHLYMRFNFEGRIIANPATAYFGKPVIVSDNPEFRGAALSNPTAAKHTLDRLLPQGERTKDFGARLAALHIKYIIVDRDDGYQGYAYLAHRSDMRPVAGGATLELYRNEAYGKE